VHIGTRKYTLCVQFGAHRNT